jgi:hypothetical protein
MSPKATAGWDAPSAIRVGGQLCAPAPTTVRRPPRFAGNSYSATFTLAGGPQPYAFAAAGLSISSGATGSHSVTVTGTEAHGLPT